MESYNTLENGWQYSPAAEFWGELAVCEHLVHVYRSEMELLDMLSGYAGTAMAKGNVTIIIATKPHLKELKKRLENLAIHVDALIKADQYLPFVAEECLDKFMVNGMPDETLFNNMISEILKKARKYNRNIYAFGEMVALLWDEGNKKATVKLEQLWDDLCRKESISLLCAYPKTHLEGKETEVDEICCAHSRIITTAEKTLTEIVYKNTSNPLADRA
jgi:predicted kinase